MKTIRLLSYRQPMRYIGRDGWIQHVHFKNTIKEIMEVWPTTIVVESIGFYQDSIGLPLTRDGKAIKNVNGRVMEGEDGMQLEIPVNGSSIRL